MKEFLSQSEEVDLEKTAEEFARSRHQGLCRPNRAQQPCLEHLREVAELTRKAGCSETAIAAAWLHDVIEDTATSLEEVRFIFGDRVAELVDGLTDPPHFSELSLIERKEMQAQRLAQKDDETALIKLCDQISNVRSVLNDPPCDWTSQKSLAYIEGAKKIADVCANRSAYLDQLGPRLN